MDTSSTKHGVAIATIGVLALQPIEAPAYGCWGVRSARPKPRDCPSYACVNSRYPPCRAVTNHLAVLSEAPALTVFAMDQWVGFRRVGRPKLFVVPFKLLSDAEGDVAQVVGLG